MFDFAALLEFLKSLFEAIMAFFKKIGLNPEPAATSSDAEG